MNAMKKQRISERGFETTLAALLGRALERRGGEVSTFEKDGVLAYNRGLVVTLPNGQEFQLTIVESTSR